MKFDQSFSNARLVVVLQPNLLRMLWNLKMAPAYNIIPRAFKLYANLPLLPVVIKVTLPLSLTVMNPHSSCNWSFVVCDQARALKVNSFRWKKKTTFIKQALTKSSKTWHLTIWPLVLLRWSTLHHNSWLELLAKILYQKILLSIYQLTSPIF